MLFPSRSRRWPAISAVGLALILTIPGPAPAQDGPIPARPPEPDRPYKAGRITSLRPLPPVAIPTDPPPHEGALFDLPVTLEPPDIIVVEVLEALPGRPLTGEHLIRSDGTISLGFYGDVHVRGLTPEQAKVKIILHLRKFLIDPVLGLYRPGPDAVPVAPVLGEDGLPIIPRSKPAEPDLKPAEPDPKPVAEPKVSVQLERPGMPTVRRVSWLARQVSSREPGGAAPALDQPPNDVAEAFKTQPPDHIRNSDYAGMARVAPEDSVVVFVDITSHNSRVYFVQGDVGTPGRLPCTGNETVLDALNFAGGFVPTAESSDIHLYRPARGDAPARDYPIDYPAILKGDVRANLQMFPGDRLVVGRNAVVRKTIEIDRVLALLNSIMNGIYQHAITSQALGSAAADLNGTNRAGRDAEVRRWLDTLRGLPGDGKADKVDPTRLLDPAPPRVEPQPTNPRN